MDDSKNPIESLMGKLSVSRRGFVKGALALGGAAAMVGCSKNDGGDIIYGGGSDTSVDIPETVAVERFYGSSGHNCGGRCVSVAEVVKGRIVRILTDENKYASDGTYLDPESRNFPQTRACARCRGYRYRLYHPGRLLYPMKQTKKRGDLTGFKRISWEQALTEIATKHKNVHTKYGADGIYSLYAWGAATGQFQGASGGPLGAGGAGGAGGAALRYMGGTQSSYFGSYSTHQYRYFGVNYTGMDENINVNSVARYASNVVLWGDNNMSTVNYAAYGYIRATEDMRARKPDAKVYFVGPYFSDGGVVTADEWAVSKPFTDPALVAGMVYHMLENTFNADGSVKNGAWLDVDYLDTMVYGFFDSPAYILNETTGAINATPGATAAAGERVVPSVPAGRSYCSWVMGNSSSAKTYSELGATTNYTAAQFAAGANGKRWAACSYEKPATTNYKTKSDFQTPKTPAWASAITGVPEEMIKTLAEVYAKKGPVTSTWSGGQQKQADGIANLFAVQALHIITKNVGTLGAGLVWRITPNVTADAGAVSVTVPRTYTDGSGNPIVNMVKPLASCTAWHTAIKMAFASELQSNGYDAKYIPNYAQGTSKTPNVYWDDAGTKAFIQWRRNADGTVKTYTDENGDTFFDWEGRTGTPTAHSGTPVYSGIRLMYNTGGNIFINQHENSNDSRQMIECLKLNDYRDADTFCLVSFDNFMSPTPRWSDYVLPAATSWEQQDIMAPSGGSQFYLPQVSTPPGESKPTWDFANELLKAYEKVAPEAEGASKDFTGGIANQTVEALVKKDFIAKSQLPTSPYYRKTWDEFLKGHYLPAKPNDDTLVASTTAYTVFTRNIAIMNAYRGLTSAEKLNPFIINTRNVATNEVDVSSGGYGNEFYSTANAPKSPLRFQVYSPVLTWQYENRFSKWHGHLPVAQRGQQHRDIEGNKIVLEIPLYYAYEDYFMEAYGGRDKLTGLTFVMTTTHDRFRSHSSMAENPMMRELTHRVPGRDLKGKAKQGNDYNHYSMAPDKAFAINTEGVYPVLNPTIKPDGTVDFANKETASYSEIYINEADGKAIGLLDGDLVQIENPIGIVRCVARLTQRCARGFVDLHQGCWYDPREIGGKTVDVGGNCNTLMASQPSRIDHGNGQQSALVKISKVENY